MNGRKRLTDKDMRESFPVYLQRAFELVRQTRNTQRDLVGVYSMAPL
jgi:hypothetical protein